MHPKNSESQNYFFNGIDPDGKYLFKETSADQIFETAQVELQKTPGDDQKRIQYLSVAKEKDHFGFDVPLHEISESGWGVIVHEDTDAGIVEEVEKLRTHRKKHGGIPDKLCPQIIKVREIPDYRSFLSEMNVSPGFGNVEKLPYYLLIIGGPDLIPYRFQYELATEYAVGRIAFKDSAGYRAYIEDLIEYETGSLIPTEQKAVFWGTANKDDYATTLSSQFLIKPLSDRLELKQGFPKEVFIGNKVGWEANKRNLADLLARKKAPALLFTASHGIGHLNVDREEKMLKQGALVTQDWRKGEPIMPDQIYSGEDLHTGANVRGMVHFAFACFGAGTPAQDDYQNVYPDSLLRPYSAAYPFVSHLATQELLNGALAFIGHVDRAWAFSFMGEKQLYLEGFERALRNMLSEKRNWPIGHCLRDLYDRALHLSQSLLEDLHDMQFGRVFPPQMIANKWVERNDARAYALIGDPAVRLRISDMQ